VYHVKHSKYIHGGQHPIVDAVVAKLVMKASTYSSKLDVLIDNLSGRY